jgi:hypothetical protein
LTQPIAQFLVQAASLIFRKFLTLLATQLIWLDIEKVKALLIVKAQFKSFQGTLKVVCSVFVLFINRIVHYVA